MEPMKPAKLELTRIGKEIRPRLEPRILIEMAKRLVHNPLYTWHSGAAPKH
jgi:hypothetical protein